MKSWRFIATILFVTSSLVFGVGCNTKTEKEVVSEKKNVAEEEKIKVVTTLFPQYDFVREIAKDKVEVSLLLPPGIEAHSYEPTPQDIVNIQKSNAFIYTGEYMEPWAHKVIESIEEKNIAIVDTSKGIQLVDEGHHEHEEEEHSHHEENKEEHSHHEDDKDEHSHNNQGKDPHIWVDPVYAQIMVDNVLEGLVKADSKNEDFYKANAIAYKEKLQGLHEKSIDIFKKTKYKKIMYGGHFALGYFAKRYGLEYVSPYTGFAPDAEPTPQKISALIDTMNKAESKVIYCEEMVDPKVARVVSEQTGAKMLVLHGGHNITKEELNSGISYLAIMEGNLENLKQGLGYDE